MPLIPLRSRFDGRCCALLMLIRWCAILACVGLCASTGETTPINPRDPRSRWPSVFARGLPPAAPVAIPALAIEPFLTRPPLTGPLVLSRLLFLGRLEGLFVKCSFCWCRRSRSRRAKHLLHSWHSNGFSLVCERSCLLRCSNLANERPQVPQTCGRGLSVFGGGNLACALGGWFGGAAVVLADVIRSPVGSCTIASDGGVGARRRDCVGRFVHGRELGEYCQCWLATNSESAAPECMQRTQVRKKREWETRNGRGNRKQVKKAVWGVRYSRD